MRTIVSDCPSCQEVEARTVYDIGDGPELSCSNCEWCWLVVEIDPVDG